MAAPDLLFNLRNSFYLGSYQSAINTSDIPNLSPEDAVERDPIVFRSHIAHGSHQLVINEIDSSAATPLQVVKLLDIYLSSPDLKVVLCVLPSSSFFSALFFIYFFCSFAFLCFFMICNLLRGPREMTCFCSFGWLNDLLVHHFSVSTTNQELYNLERLGEGLELNNGRFLHVTPITRLMGDILH
ncbi:hypothetical protein RND81_06G136800 [Saponaria officinalis]|uniref:Uncharacterized protein n=1 Tax=Saponaria officinalis TaxID=3572 RepID=A0AAW1KB24_SAPOF